MNESHVERDDVKAWISHPVTRVVFKALIDRFDHQQCLFGASLDEPLARYKGRAEVLEFLHNPKMLIDIVYPLILREENNKV